MAINGYNPYGLGQVYPSMGYTGNLYNSYPAQSFASPAQTQQYMINVDGEGAAKAWQIPGGQAPNLIIPLWDLDGKHVYFKSTDAYGRMNPLRKGVIVLEEDTVQQTSGDPAPQIQYVTKDDLESFKNEIKNLLTQQNNQNGSRNNRGDNR